MDKQGHVYILASARHGTLYVGVTSDLVLRISQHRAGVFDGFTKDYDVKRLVWQEAHATIEPANAREKRIKEWRRDWKITLIEAANPGWEDLALGLGFAPLVGAAKRSRTIP